MKSYNICSRNRERVIPVLEKAGLLTGSVLLLKIRNNHRKLFMKTSIYHLLDECGNIRNVGKTSKALEVRLQQHIREARGGTKNHRCNWIRSMLTRGLSPTIELQTEVNSDGCKAEIAYIAYYRKMGFDLVNGTDGGEGCLGWVPSKETRLKIGRANKGHKWTEAQKNNVRGRKDTQTTCLKKSSSRKGLRLSASAILKLKMAYKYHAPSLGTHQSEETKRKIKSNPNAQRTRFHKGLTPWNKGTKGVCVSWMKGKHPSEESSRKNRESHKGKIPWNKGQKMGEEQRHKLIGHTVSEKTRQKIRDTKN